VNDGKYAPAGMGTISVVRCKTRFTGVINVLLTSTSIACSQKEFLMKFAYKIC
jgi:hypothetical protein